jgi:hypothetical protein
VDDLERLPLRQAAHARRIQDFLNRWKPTEPHEARDFEVEVYELILQTQEIAQAPILHTMSAALSRAPLILPLDQSRTKERPNG